MNVIASKNKEKLAEDLLKHYLERGFGAMSKREIDVLMMHLIIKYADISDKSNYELSMMFKITETKMKNLKLEAQLHYQEDSDAYVKKEFFELLKVSKLKIDSPQNWIILSVENTYLKLAIEAKLKQNGNFADYSFNRELLKIEQDAFIELLEQFYTDDDLEEFVSKTKTIASKKDEINFKSLMKIFLENFSEQAGKEMAGTSIEMGKVFLSGGTTGIYALANNVMKIFRN